MPTVFQMLIMCKICYEIKYKRNILLASSPGHDLQHFPGNNMGSSQLGLGQSFFMFRH